MTHAACDGPRSRRTRGGGIAVRMAASHEHTKRNGPGGGSGDTQYVTS